MCRRHGRRLREDHGEDASRSLAALYEIGRTFGMAIGSAGYKLPKSPGAVIDGVPTLRGRDTMRWFLPDSAADMIGKFVPVILSFVQSKGGDGVKGILEKALKRRLR